MFERLFLFLSFRYVPTEYLGCVDNLTEQQCQDISNVNAELVHKLKATDSAFSLGTLQF